ncbi:MAG: mannonate dehydratase [Anaerolineae bacterium]
MRMTMRWFGADDRVTLGNIRQVPGMVGIVTALYDLPPGAVWPLDRLEAVRHTIEAAGMVFEVAESLPVAEEIKLGLPNRDHLIENYCASIRNLGKVGVKVLCYNYMPIFSWTRTNLALPMPDGSTALAYSQSELEAMDLSQGVQGLPGWDQSYTADALNAMFRRYEGATEAQLFESFVYFLKAIVPVAEQAGVLLALHPDDPPWSLLGMPRIVRNAADFQRLLDAVPSRFNGICFCTGSLGALPENDLPAMVNQFADRIHFVHGRNIKRTAPKTFHEVAHPSRFGDVDMYAVIKALYQNGFAGPIRSDHGRMIWGETGRPGYGLYDRALGTMYLTGLIEAIARER